MAIRSPVVTLDDLRIEAAMRPTELAREAGISLPTWYRIARNEPVGEIFVRKVLLTLSKKLDRTITLEDVDAAYVPEKR